MKYADDAGRRHVLAGLAALSVSSAIGRPAQAGQDSLPEQFRWHSTPQPPLPPVLVQDLSGHDQSLQSVDGRVGLINFWATWCGPCILELPSLLALQRQIGDARLSLVGVSTDRDRAAIDRFLGNNRLTDMRIVRDADRRLFRAVGAQVLPTTLVLDRMGREVARVRGPVTWDDPRIVRRLSALLS